MIMWSIISLVLAIWMILTFVLHKRGYVHILLLFGVSMLVVQIIAYRKAQYHRLASKDNH